MHTGAFLKLFTYVRSYPVVVLFCLFLIVIACYLAAPISYSRIIPAPQGENDRLYFGGAKVVSQEFIPHTGLSEINVPVGSADHPKTPLILHIRKSADSSDIVAIPLFSLQNETAKFRFNPILLPPSRLVWIIEAPHAAGNSFWTYREQDVTAFPEGHTYQNNRSVKGNIGFSEVWTYPRFAAIIHTFKTSSGHGFAPFEYASAYAGIAALAGAMLLKRRNIAEKTIVLWCIALGIALHIWLALTTPVIIDEGAYIQDILQASHHLLPFRDFLTKGPAYLFILWLWSFIVPHTVVAWRLLSAILWALGTWWFWQLAIEFDLQKRSRLLATAAFGIMPASIALSTPLLLETASIPISLLGLLCIIRSAKKSSWKLAALAGAVFAMAFFVRVTAAIPACIALIALLVFAKKQFKIKLAGAYIATGLLLFGLMFCSSVAIMGIHKASVVVNMEALLISQNRQQNVQVSDAPSDPAFRTIIIQSRLLWRTGVLFVASLFLIPLLLIDRRRILLSFSIFTALFFACRYVVLTLYDTGFLLPKHFATSVPFILIIIIGVPLLTAFAAFFYNRTEKMRDHSTQALFVILFLVWLAFSGYAYAKYGRFRQSYLTEFIPQLALFFGVGFHFLFTTWSSIRPVWLSRLLTGGMLFLMGAGVYQGYAMAEMFPHTGTVDQGSLVRIVSLIQENVPKGDMIFTAQPVATAFSERQIMFGYSHPGWYREAMFGTVSVELRNLLFRTPEAITDYLKHEAEFVLTDSRTNEIYFDGYPERAAILKQDFEEISSTINETAGDTYTLYRRR